MLSDAIEVSVDVCPDAVSDLESRTLETAWATLRASRRGV